MTRLIPWSATRAGVELHTTTTDYYYYYYFNQFQKHRILKVICTYKAEILNIHICQEEHVTN